MKLKADRLIDYNLEIMGTPQTSFIQKPTPSNVAGQLPDSSKNISEPIH